jgi:23S rRNA (cytosine1962-C5)-methyltransferase
LDDAFFRRRIEAATLYREARSLPATGRRLVYSEGDQLPGLILDQYGDLLVLQALTLGIDQRKARIVEIARQLFQPKAIVERSDVASRKLEGLDETIGVLFGETDGMVRLPLDEFSVDINVLEDQKTGFFLDQRLNYALVAGYCAGKRVLDCFSYHGAFALAAARAGANSVEAVESSDKAIVRARRNAELNAVEGRIEFICANAFDVLKHYDAESRQFDLIVLDPPSFTRTKANVDDALRGYKEINLRALKMLPRGGVLATFSCSHHIGAELFRAMIVDAAADARKPVRLLEKLTQSPDHPILPAVPETEYLRGMLLEVI